MQPRPEHRLEVGDVRLAIDLEAGGRATRWDVGGHSLLAHHGDLPEEHGMYPMAPWAGRLRDNALLAHGRAHPMAASFGPWAIHGLAYTAPVEVLEAEQSDDFARLAVRVDHSAGWPWPMAIDLVWELSARELTTTILVNAFEDAFPAVVGWHPWFRRHLDTGDALEWSVEAEQLVLRGDDYLPTGQVMPFADAVGPFDDAVWAPSGRASVRWPGALAIDIVNDAPWFVVFDQLPDAACIEPQSGPPNGVNDGLGHPISLAAPGRPHVLTTRWRMRDDPPAGQG
jgi:galactose mutarotase-like enzyme